MILPNTLLDQLEYYESVKDYQDGDMGTKVTLHFKSFWKFKRVIFFKWSVDSIDKESELISYQEPSDCVELRSQLHNYFKGK